MKVFLVDDNDEAVKLIGFALHRAGYEVAIATNGAEAIAKIPVEQPDIVILDVMMPEMSGIQVARELRSKPETADIPIILLTARGETQDKLEGFGAGADDYIVKPVPPAELIVRINALIRRVKRYSESTLPRGRLIGFLGVKGGVGTTTLAVNSSIALAQEGQTVILVDLSLYTGTAALQMGITPRTGLSEVIDREPAEITRRLIETGLEHHSSGVKVLAMPHSADADAHEFTAGQVAAILAPLETMAEAIVLDLGNGLSPASMEAIARCHLVVLVFEGDTVALTLARETIDRLKTQGIRVSNLGLVMVNRSRTASSFTRTEIEQQLGYELLALITPAPEIAFLANKQGKPILLSQPDTVIAAQMKQLSSKVK